jgi:hypothetical protein
VELAADEPGLLNLGELPESRGAARQPAVSKLVAPVIAQPEPRENAAQQAAQRRRAE